MNIQLGFDETSSDEESISGGKSKSLIKSKNEIDIIINSFNEKRIYKMNSFGPEYIGNGLNPIIILNLKNKFRDKRNIKIEEVKQYLISQNIFYY